MEGSIYILQFKNEGELEDIVLYLDRKKAMDSLRKKWQNRSIIEFKLEDGVAENATNIYTCNENGEITQFKI